MGTRGDSGSGSGSGSGSDAAPGGGSDIVALPPSALARRAAGVGRHRAIARALHAGPPARTPQITERLDALRAQIAEFRARAIELHAKLVELESNGDPGVHALRAQMMASVVRIEGVVRALIETPDPAARPPRLARGTGPVK